MSNKSTYNPAIHHRRAIRLKGYDYTKAGLYFITICCRDRLCRFGHIVGAGFTSALDSHPTPVPDRGNREGCPTSARMVLNELGEIAYREWVKLSERFPAVELDVFQIMPNHMHGIIILTEPAGETVEDGVGNGVDWARVNRAPTVGDVVGAYKSLVANARLAWYKSKNETMGKLWQRNYYEHIIRHASAYQNISDYIIHNPSKWHEDRFYS
jgi:putative transposase